MKKTSKLIIFLFIIGSIIIIINPKVLAYNYSSYHGIGMGSSGAYNLAQGMTFTVIGGNVTMLNVIKSSTTTCTQAILFSNSTGTILATNTLTSDNSTFIYDLVNGTTYNIACNKTSGTYIRVYADGTGQPAIINNGIRWDKGFSTDEGDSTYFFNFLGIQLLYPEGNVTPINTFNVIQQSDNQINTSKYDAFIVKTLITPTSPTTNMSALNGSYTTLWYSINTTLNNGCAIFYGKSCVQSGTYINKTMTMDSNNTNQTLYNYSFSFEDNEYYPAYYPFDYRLYEKTTHLNQSIYNNNVLRFNVFNFSTATNYFLNLEFMAINGTGGSGNLNIYYCNSSYSTGNPATNTNCELVDSFAPTINYTHSHSYSKHQGVPIRIITVKKTQNSSFIFTSSATLPSAWLFGYITNSSYTNNSFVVGNYNTWGTIDLTNNKLFNIHLHPINISQDNFRFYSVFNNGNGTINTSTTKYVFYNQTYRNPNAVNTILPSCNYSFVIGNTTPIDILWTNSTSDLNLSITYNISIHNGLAFYINITNNTFYNWSNWNNIMTTAGTYHFDITSCDLYGCDTGHSCDFTVCKNIYTKSNQPCISNVKIISYYDNANCGQFFDIPLDNNTYEDCVIPSTIGETNITNGLYTIALTIIVSVLIYLAIKKRETK